VRHSIHGLLVAVLVVAATPAAATDTARYTAESRAAVKEFGATLKGELVAALKAGGAVNGITVCNEKAPAIAADISDSKGWRIARTSLKLRNPGNAPDAWERSVLTTFEARKAAGEDPQAMEHAEVVSTDDGDVFRYMKAIPTAAKPCLACHGKTLDPAVDAVLRERYPDDQARGYKAGDIRGAFTISIPVK
jgi:hypothetical protein